jgi:hypothetical protein
MTNPLGTQSVIYSNLSSHETKDKSISFPVNYLLWLSEPTGSDCIQPNLAIHQKLQHLSFWSQKCQIKKGEIIYIHITDTKNKNFQKQDAEATMQTITTTKWIRTLNYQPEVGGSNEFCSSAQLEYPGPALFSSNQPFLSSIIHEQVLNLST